MTPPAVERLDSGARLDPGTRLGAGVQVRPRHCMVVHAQYPLHEPRVSREAEALVAAGYDVDVVCLRQPGQPARERHRGVEIHRLPVALDKRTPGRQLICYTRFLLRAAAYLGRVHARRPYGTVQAHNLPDFLVFSALAPKLAGTPVLLDLHDLMPEFFAARFGSRPGSPGSALTRLVRAQERASCRFADHVITVSDAWRDALVERGVAPEKCSVVMNVADPSIFRRRPRPPRTSASEFRLVYHGQITRRYGLDLLVHAVKLLQGDIPHLHLTIHGRGDDASELARLVARLGIAQQVHLSQESLPTEALPDLIAAADLAVVPYRDDVFTDGIVPTKLMEYAAVGVPCVAARTSAIERYFTGTMAEFFEPGDAHDLARRIRELHTDPVRLDELARRSRRFTDRYNWEQIGAGYVDLVDRLRVAGVRPATRSGLTT